MLKFILTDIEGTTTSISFVHRILFPYAKKNLRNYVQAHLNDENVKQCLADVAETVKIENSIYADAEKCIEYLEKWIDEDRKHPALKTLQGFIWETGYENGDFTGHIYNDVPKCFDEWKKAGLQMGVYSSGSVEAQKLLFKYSDFGDLTSYFSAYFDTSVGHKREVISYKNIILELGFQPIEIMFLSDIEEELDAAKEAGMQTTQLIRDESTKSAGRHLKAKDFFEIAI